MPRPHALAVALPAALAACAVGLLAGSTGVVSIASDIFWQIRLPRVLAGFGSGAALAVSGALMQLLSRNALADPYVLGIAGGASVGALGTMLLFGAGSAASAEWSVAIGAAVGAFLAAALLFALMARRLAGSVSTAQGDTSTSLLLVGIMIGSGCSALVSLILSLASDGQLRGMVFWLLGDLNGATHWEIVWLALAAALALVLPTARQLDWLARGDAWAATLGVPVARRRRVVIAAAAIATGAAVATAGAIGFVGLVVPHMLRLVGVRSAAALLWASALGGGAFVVLADAIARTVVAPLQLPVGVLAAAVGVPTFIFMLLRRPPRSGA
ncbi:MAG: iron ABC transporter permease [Pseudomonadota bacterium]|nr:iron ABC transporter permease [Pseudomonadota bacterium]